MDASKIISDLGGDRAVASVTGRPENTVAYWRHRNSIPADYWADLLTLAPGHEAETARLLIEHRAKRRARSEGAAA